LKSAVITVGDGRGFVVEHGYKRFVVTAAHCLQRGNPPEHYLPPAHGASYLQERTYPNLLAPLGEEPAVWAECVFVDPVADIALLGTPDNQELGEQADAYEALTEAASALPISRPPKDGPAFVLSLTGEIVPCTVRCIGDGPLFLFDTGLKEGAEGGMSGSPIIVADGSAIGVVCLGNNAPQYGIGPNPCLMHHLPGWLLRELESRRD
jgi:hypothetical protein